MGNHKSKVKKSKTKKAKSKLSNTDLMANPDFTAYNSNNSAVINTTYNKPNLFPQNYSTTSVQKTVNFIPDSMNVMNQFNQFIMEI